MKCSTGENTSIKFTGNVNLKKWFLSDFFAVKPSLYHTCTSQKWVMYFSGYLCVLADFIFTDLLNFPVGFEIHKQNTCNFLETYFNFSVDWFVLPIVLTLYCLVLCHRFFSRTIYRARLSRHRCEGNNKNFH